MNYDDVPWTDSTQWKPGCWYPLPNGSHWINTLEFTVVEGYSLYIQDPEGSEDILPVLDLPPFTFQVAVKICEAHNGWKFEL